MAGLATSGVRSAPERTARARSPEPPTAARPALQTAPAAEGPATTRDRLAASFAAPPALEVAPAPEVAASAPAPSSPAAAPPPGAGPSVRERIATRARTEVAAVEEPAPATPVARPLAPVIDLAAERERRRPSAEPVTPAGPEPEKPVVAPLVEPVARGPPPAARAEARPAPPVAAAPTAAPKPPEPEAVEKTPAPEQVPAAEQAPAAEPAVEPAPVAAEAAPEAAAPTPAIAAAEAEAAPPEAEPAAEAEPVAEEEPAAEPEVEAVAAPPGPESEPGFQAMQARAQEVAAQTKEHQPAAEGVATTQAAAPAPANDLETQAQTAKVEVMGEQEPKPFDKQAFIAAVKAAIEAATPKTLEDVDEFKGSGAVGKATEQVSGLVKDGKAASEQDIATATAAPLDISKAVEKPAADMVNDEPGEATTDVGAANAMPTPRPPEAFDFSDGPAKVDTEMAQANVTDEQLARSGEPDFTAAVASRDKAREHAAAAAPALRADEDVILTQGREAASADAAGQLEAMHGARAAGLETVLGDKEGLKTEHETEHARVTSEIQAIYTATESDVRELLDGLDEKVETTFTAGEEAARTAFEDYVDKRMRDYKDDRYDRIGGSLLWLKDKIAGMPDEVDEFYVEGRDGYIRDMDAVIEQIATIVGTDLTAARARIVEGRAEVRAYVEALPENLKTIGTEAEEKLETQFEQLGSEVDSKQDAVVDTVARRYVEARGALDERIEELKKANQGLVAAALDAVVGVIKTILALGEMLLRILAKAAEVVGDIISDPIGFLDNLVSAVMGGLNRFVNRIGEHLQNALVEWLFGTMGKVGITPPDALDGPGILHLVTQVIGLTYDAIRARVVRVIGEPAMAGIEEGVELFKTLAAEGVGGLWELISAQVGDLEDMVIGRIKDWVIERVIKGGIAWIIGLLNPVAAFIKACKAIYEIVMFIAERAKQIAAFVESVLDSISAIAKGDLGAAEEKVESSLARALPLAIGFLASLLGIGGIAEKVRSIVAAVKRPIERAVDKVVLGAARAYKRSLGRVAAKPAEARAAPAKKLAAEAAEEGAARGAKGDVEVPKVDPRDQALALLKPRLAKAESLAEIEKDVDQVRAELKPSGLSRLELHGPNPEGEYSIHAAASELKQLNKLVPALSGRRSVKMNVRLLTTSPDPDLTGIGAAREPERDPSTKAILTDEQGEPRMRTTHFSLPPVLPKGRQRTQKTVSGGVALPPKPGSGEVRLLTYNTSDAANASSNATHAEAQLLEFLERARPLAQDVKEVHADINYSPCSLCSADLSHISRVTPNATRRIMRWRRLYTHPDRGTSDKSLGGITGWTVIPGSVGGTKTPEEDALLKAANWTALTRRRKNL